MRYLIYNHNNHTFVVTTTQLPGRQEPCASVFSSSGTMIPVEKYIHRRYGNTPKIIRYGAN